MSTLPARNLLAAGAVLSTACHLQHGGNASPLVLLQAQIRAV